VVLGLLKLLLRNVWLLSQNSVPVNRFMLMTTLYTTVNVTRIVLLVVCSGGPCNDSHFH